MSRARPRPALTRRPLAVLLLAIGLVATACNAEAAAIPGAIERIEDPFAGGYPIYRDTETGLRVVVGTPDLAAGSQRVALALFDDRGLVSQPGLTVRTYFYPGGPGRGREGPLEEQRLDYAEFPLGGRSIYRGTLSFPHPGLYAIEADVPREDGTARLLIPLEVAPEPRAPAVGDPAPPSRHRTLADVASIEELTTSYAPDPALYRVTIADAVAEGRPFVVVFTSPAFCTTALCGPQAELLGELAADHAGAAEFIHIDLYENPHEIRGDLDRARRSPVLDEWGVATDQWTFVVGADGRVLARFEGFVPRDELEAALLEATTGS